jgi:hypothetical protein
VFDDLYTTQLDTMVLAMAGEMLLQRLAQRRIGARCFHRVRWRRMGGPAKRDLRKRLLTLISCLFAGLCPGPDLARSVQGVAADPAESRPGAVAGCPALSGGLDPEQHG